MTVRPGRRHRSPDLLVVRRAPAGADAGRQVADRLRRRRPGAPTTPRRSPACSPSGTWGRSRAGSTAGRSRSPTPRPSDPHAWATAAEIQQATADGPRRGRQARRPICRPSSTASTACPAPATDADGDGYTGATSATTATPPCTRARRRSAATASTTTATASSTRVCWTATPDAADGQRRRWHDRSMRRKGNETEMRIGGGTGGVCWVVGASRSRACCGGALATRVCWRIGAARPAAAATTQRRAEAGAIRRHERLRGRPAADRRRRAAAGELPGCGHAAVRGSSWHSPTLSVQGGTALSAGGQGQNGRRRAPGLVGRHSFDPDAAAGRRRRSRPRRRAPRRSPPRRWPRTCRSPATRSSTAA